MHPLLPRWTAAACAYACAGLAFTAPPASGSEFHLRRDTGTGAVEILDGSRPVLAYQAGTNAPGDRLAVIAPDNRKYAVARGDYLHPLRGPSGESLTLDWPVDHPHHRGIYWAWPEVDWHGRRGDLHALQEVFARPDSPPRFRASSHRATLDAECTWRWQNLDPVVREHSRFVVHEPTADGRAIDLVFRFEAVRDPVQIARRGTDKYGGLNVRLAAIRDVQAQTVTDGTNASPRAAWAQIHGRFADAAEPATLLILQHPGNPEYPGDWVQYPELNWLQPTFPAAGHRFELRRGKPLTLRYRLWICPKGPLPPEQARALWNEFRREKP